MAAGLGFKTFTTGEVLTSGDVNGYLMQGILVFASEAARDASITSPQEGQFAFTKDNNSLWYYTGSAWAASGATGDIEGVTAGVGISGGGTSGTVTITNSMATAIDAKGDLVVGTGADTFARLASSATNGDLLTVDTSTATGLKWATPTAGSSGMTLITNTSFSASSAVNINNCFSSTYKNYKIMTSYTTSNNSGSSFRFRNGGSDITTSTYAFSQVYIATGTQLLVANNSQPQLGILGNTAAGATNYMFFELTDVFASSCKFGSYFCWADNSNFAEANMGQWKNQTNSTFDGFSIYPGAGTITGSVQVYGLAN